MYIGKICPQCGLANKAKKVARGSFGMELILWLLSIVFSISPFLAIAPFLFLIALIYSLWRLFTKYKVCASCGNENLIDIDSPKGKELLDKYYPE